MKFVIAVGLFALIPITAAGQSDSEHADGDDRSAEWSIPDPEIGFLLQTDACAESRLTEDGFVVRAARVIAPFQLARK